jgi:hypothetical protein
MSSENMLAYAIKQKEIDYNATDLVLLQAQLINKDENNHIMVEKVAKDADSYAAGKYYIPGVAMHFGEHPEEAGHRILTEELEIKDREITKKLIQTIILNGNDIIKWKLLSPMKSDSGKFSEFATISYGPNGIVGYRMGFELKGKLVMITTFATSPREAMKTILETSINIDKNN